MKIVIPIDFFPASHHALKFALELGSLLSAEVHAVHFIQLTMMPETTFGIQPPPVDRSLTSQLQARAHILFKKMMHDYNGQTKVTFKCFNDTVVNGVISYIRKSRAQLIVVSPNNKASEQLVFGSIAKGIIRHSNVPVFAVPFEKSCPSIQSIVFPIDLSTNEKRILQKVKILQVTFNAKLHVVYVNTPDHFISSTESGKALEDFARHHHLTNYALITIDHNTIWGGIRQYLEDIGGDLVALGTEGRKGLGRIIHPSISEAVFEDAQYLTWVCKLSD